MPKYRLKSEEELVWNAVRRAATAQVNLEALAWKERRINDILPALQVEFQRMVQDGNLPELDEKHMKQWVKQALEAARRPKLDAVSEGVAAGAAS